MKGLIFIFALIICNVIIIQGNLTRDAEVKNYSTGTLWNTFLIFANTLIERESKIVKNRHKGIDKSV